MGFLQRHRCVPQYTPAPEPCVVMPQVQTFYPAPPQACPQIYGAAIVHQAVPPGEDILKRTGEHKTSSEQSAALESKRPGQPENNCKVTLNVLNQAQGRYQDQAFSVEYDKNGKVKVTRDGKEVKSENLAFYADGKLYKADGSLMGEMGIEKSYTAQLKTNEIIQANATLQLSASRYHIYSRYTLTLDDKPLIIINRPPPGSVRVYERQEARLLQDSKDGGLALGSEKPSSYSIRWVPEKEAEKYFRGASEYSEDTLRQLYLAKEKTGEVDKDKSFELQKGVRVQSTKDGFVIRFTSNLPTTLIGDDGLTKAPGRVVSEYAKSTPKPSGEQKNLAPAVPSTSDSPPLVIPPTPLPAPESKGTEKAPPETKPPAIVPPPSPPMEQTLPPPPPAQTPAASPPPVTTAPPELSIPANSESNDKPNIIPPEILKPQDSPKGSVPEKPPGSGSVTPKSPAEDPNKKWRDVDVRYSWMARYKQSPFIEQEGYVDIKKSNQFTAEEKTQILQACKDAFESGDRKDMKVGFWYRRSQNMGHHLMLCKADEETFVMDVVSGGLCSRSELYTRNNVTRIFFRKEADSWSIHIQKEKGNDGKQGFTAVAKDKVKEEGTLLPRLLLASDSSTPLEEFTPQMEWGPKLLEPTASTKTVDRPTRDPFWAGTTTTSRDLSAGDIACLKDKTVGLVSGKGAPEISEEKDEKGRLTKVTVDFVLKKDGTFGPNSSYDYMGGDKRARVFIHDKGVLIWTEADSVMAWDKSFGEWRSLANAQRTDAKGKRVSAWEKSIHGTQNKLVSHLESFFEPQHASK